MSKHMALLFKMKRMLEFHARSKGAEQLQVKITDYSQAEMRLEDDGRTYIYPETFSIRIENRTNHHYDLRLKDGRMIREGMNLNAKGQSIAQVYRRQLKELKAWKGA